MSMASCFVMPLPESSFSGCFELHFGSEQKNIDVLIVEFFNGFIHDKQYILNFESQKAPHAEEMGILDDWLFLPFNWTYKTNRRTKTMVAHNGIGMVNMETEKASAVLDR